MIATRSGFIVSVDCLEGSMYDLRKLDEHTMSEVRSKIDESADQRRAEDMTLENLV